MHLQSVVTLVGMRDLRYTPAGIPVLELALEHQSEQECSWGRQKIHANLRALLFGDDALHYASSSYQNRQMHVSGFLHQHYLRRSQLVLLIQTIDLVKES